VELGWPPGKLVVHLTRGSGFRPSLESITEPWEPGTVISLIFTPPNGDPVIEWPATVAGVLASWTVSAAEVAAVLDAGCDSVMLMQTEPGVDPDVWEKGYVHVH
jgi:hypothetical protein